MASDAVKLAKIQSRDRLREQSVQIALEVVRNPVLSLLGAWWLNEAAYRFGAYGKEEKDAGALVLTGVAAAYAVGSGLKAIAPAVPAIAGIAGKVL